jgi:predicted NBD/HSP70 family sugar kinase
VTGADLQPGVPSLLRLMNDRRALEAMMAHGRLTRGELGRRIGVSRVTASQSLSRLQSRGLVQVVGSQSAGRGPNAEVYSVADVGWALGLEVTASQVGVTVAEVGGNVAARAHRDCRGADPVEVCGHLLDEVLAERALAPSDVLAAVVGAPGLIDPGTGEVSFSYDLPSARGRLRRCLQARVSAPVEVENDVNLASLAEERDGAAIGAQDYVLLWLGRGIGLGVVLGGRLHRGATGAAGEIGYLPVPGVSLPERVDYVSQGSFQRLVGSHALGCLAVEHGLLTAQVDDPAAVADLIVGAVRSDAAAFLGEVAARIALGVAAVCSVLDPSLVVLTGETGRAGGDRLATLVGERIQAVAPVHPRVVASSLGPDAVLHGATLRAVDTARTALLARVEDDPVE